MNLLKLFCLVDDFWKGFEIEWRKYLLSQKHTLPKRSSALSMSEVMTIIILFHRMGYRNFKTFYIGYVLCHLRSAFPNSPGYNQFLNLKKQVVFPLHCLLMNLTGSCTGISFIDSTSLAVCHPKRNRSNKTFRNIAKTGKTTKGWFFGFKLHLIVNEHGEIISWMLTPGDVHDLASLDQLSKELFGKLIGDKGFISKRHGALLLERGLQLITKLRNNMKNKLMLVIDKLLLRKRGIIESVIDQLKNISQIEHSRHRSPINFCVNLLAGLIAYSLQPKKPSLNLEKTALKLLVTK